MKSGEMKWGINIFEIVLILTAEMLVCEKCYKNIKKRLIFLVEIPKI